MKRVCLLLALVAFGTAALARIPLLSVSCPGGIEVHADKGGPVCVNGDEAKLNKSNDNYCEARHGHVTISISISPDGSADVSYTGQGGANGVCQISDGGAGGGGCPPDVGEADRYTYLACD